ncbi:MAG: hypothetical protein O2822_01915 [Chloroflexi bacterium]|nr:hypothetical protein [Chloroflexota bacterium]
MTPREPAKPDQSQPIKLDQIKAAHAAKIAGRRPLGSGSSKA